jgi:hypothetical protein
MATNPFASALAVAEEVSGKKVEVKRSVIPNMSAIRLHNNLGDQDILVKFYGTNADITDITPSDTFFDGLQDRESVETMHASFAKEKGKDEKSYASRERDGLVDTADSKMEARGNLQAGYFFKHLNREGFKPLQIRVFKKIRSEEEKRRIETAHGKEAYHDQFVLEIRLTHESIFEEKLAACKAVGMGGLQPNHLFFRKLKNILCECRWGACTVFSNNTATFDPSITVNFRDGARRGQDAKELTVTDDGRITWVPVE